MSLTKTDSVMYLALSLPASATEQDFKCGWDVLDHKKADRIISAKQKIHFHVVHVNMDTKEHILGMVFGVFPQICHTY